MLDTGVKITNSLSFVWLVEFRNYKWGTAGYNFDESYYTGKITDFSGVDENICRPEDNNITEKTISFSIPDENGRISASRGESVILRLIINDQQFLSWNFVVTSFTNYYNKANFNCSDFLSYLIEDVKYPKTDLVNPLDTSSATHSGSEDVCVPEIYGNPYIPLRSLLISSERAYILGPDDGSTYTIDSVSYPVEWDVKAEFLSSEYTFTQSSYNNLRVFVPYIASGGTAGFFQNSGSLLDMPTKVKKSTTQSITNPIDILTSIFLNLGLTLSAIDSVSAAACAATYNTLGISLDVGLYQKEDAKNVISKILSACNSTINVYDKIYFKYLGDSSLATITKNDISNFSFSENILKNINDAGIAEYYETIQAGDPKQIYVPLTGETYSNSSTDTFKVEYLRDSVLVQQLARIYFRKKYWNSGSISFNAKKRYLSYECGDKITIQDDLYHNGDYFISSKKISDDLTLQFSCDMYLDDIGQILDYDPDPLTVISDVSGRIYYSDVAFKTTGYANAGNCQIYGNTITKISGADSWTNAAAHSTDSFLNSVKLTFKGSQVTADLAIGISTNPTALINYTSIDYCWMLKSDGTCEAFASGVSLGTYGTYTTSSVFSIGYDGYHIYFYIDEVLKYTVDVSYSLRFYLDSSFYTLNGAVNAVTLDIFGDITETKMANGIVTQGYIGNKAIDDDPDLGIDFNNKTIIVGGTGELTLSGSLTVESTGGITVNSGGDLTLISQSVSPYDTANIYFKYSDTDLTPVYLGAKYSFGESIPKIFYIDPQDQYTKKLSLGVLNHEWSSLNGYSRNIYLHASLSTSGNDYTSLALSPAYFNVISDGSDSSYGYGTLRIIHDEVVQYSYFYDDQYIYIKSPIILNEGLIFSQVPILSSPGATYDSHLPYKGNFYFYINSSDNLPYIRYKNNSGTYVTKAI